MNHEGHEGHEGTESILGDDVARRGMRLASPLKATAERLMTETIGCAIRVHRVLGPGFLESIYRKAMCVELEAADLPFEVERAVSVRYRDVDLGGQRVDLIVGGEIVVELKAVRRIDDIHRAQLISYLKTTGLRGGLLINFHVPVLRDGLKRIVL